MKEINDLFIIYCGTRIEVKPTGTWRVVTSSDKEPILYLEVCHYKDKEVKLGNSLWRFWKNETIYESVKCVEWVSEHHLEFMQAFTNKCGGH